MKIIVRDLVEKLIGLPSMSEGRRILVAAGVTVNGVSVSHLGEEVAEWQQRVDVLPESEGAARGLERAKRKLRLANEHRDAIEYALSQGKPVPAEVLVDYPTFTKHLGF